MDCCRTYSLPATVGKRGPPEPTGLKAMAANAGSLIAFACAPGTIAVDADGSRNVERKNIEKEKCRKERRGKCRKEKCRKEKCRKGKISKGKNVENIYIEKIVHYSS